MDESELRELAYNVVDDAIDHVFLRFPEDGAVRARVYRYVANELIEMAAVMEQPLD